MFFVTSILLLALILFITVNEIGVAPRTLAPYIVHRASGHNLLIENAGEIASKFLLRMDRGESNFQFAPKPSFGVLGSKDKNYNSNNIVLVGSVHSAKTALRDAKPGDVITFLPGTYRFSGKYLELVNPGRAGQEIVIRAEQPGSVVLEFDMSEGFWITAPYWMIENLIIKGVCEDHSYCEHALHVVGNAKFFVLRNNVLIDFNSHIKINGDQGRFPDSGLIENNIIKNSTPRNTGNPVTLIDLVAASDWVVRENFIADFIKLQSDGISYGAFAKGAGDNNTFERNIVICEYQLRNHPGKRVGVSLGGGGTYPAACRDKRCITEQQKSFISSNLIASCSDNGIYINKSAESYLSHNTLLDTGPIMIRFPESSANVEGNLVDSAIQARGGALIRSTDNIQTSIWKLFLGFHPVRNMFISAESLDLTWKDGAPIRRLEQKPPDLCNSGVRETAAYGASNDYSRCFRTGDNSLYMK